MRMLLLLVACIGWSCTDHENPLALISIPAGKVHVDSDSDECLAISWACDTEVDSVWTVFYGSDYRFQVHDNERVLFSHYLDSNSKTQYWASETSTHLGRVRSGFRSDDETCGIWSEAIDNDTSVVRIYKGDVKYLYRDSPSARYVLSEDDEDYPVAFVQEEGAVRHRDFYSLFNRNEPRPDSLVTISNTYSVSAYYLPVNFSDAALDTLTILPQDDRPYLDDSICAGDECPEWEEPICPPEVVVVQAASASGGRSTSGGGDVASQTPQVLVSNLGLTTQTLAGVFEGATSSQGFRTGTNAGGYTLTSIDLLTGYSAPDFIPIPDFLPTVTLHSGSRTGSKVADFTTTSSGPDFAVYTFIPTTTVTLDMNTDYWVKVHSASVATLLGVAWIGEDATSAPGWSIPYRGQYDIPGEGSGSYGDDLANQFRVNGIIK